ncbi:adhesion G protein-coupled receptor E1-like [Puntigrus tetrazona]|uniref:adhesion G protein-coupled receptor E1-like n=2 Tax=Puntigrus tetrazona TaxID=1606681 RepID=UPI001C8AC25A|nr:adhesion G protein-coupled receptor E1-like [Puntigrus tetrazona]
MDTFHKIFIKAPLTISVVLYVLTLNLVFEAVTMEEATDASLSVDPCNSYSVLDEPRRSINNTNYLQSPQTYNCDTSVTWSGWYRLFINGLSAHMPETCVAKGHCDTATTLWIRGGHPKVEDGIVTRDVCGHWDNYCCFFWSFPIKVKACPGSYYVYELISPAVYCSGYCADVSSITTSSTAVTPASLSNAYSFDPCYNYSVLDDPWRANGSQPSNMCDNSLNWSGWYRLFINNVSAQIPDTCVKKFSCGTQNPLGIRGGHPTVKNGVVTRDVCGQWNNYCCYFGSYPIKVKACPGRYYVYELVRPTLCAAYCAVVTNISATETTMAPETSSDDYIFTDNAVKIMLLGRCTTSLECLQHLLEQIDNITAQVLSLDTVTEILTVIFNTSEKILESSSASDYELAFFGNCLIKTSEKVISTLVKPTDTSDNVNFALPAVEVQVFMVGQWVSLEKIPQLNTTKSSAEVDLIGIAKNNYKRSAAVAFMSYTMMENFLKPDFFNTSNDTIKTMLSTVISATLPKTTNTKLTKPVNFTLKHIREFDPSGSLSCVYWNISEWVVDGCSVLETNSSFTVCSCVHLSTFALIMQTSRPPERDSLMEQLNMVCVIVGLVFFSLALLTFALCQWSPGVNNVARINICISLLLAHLLFLLTQQFLKLIRPQQELCAVIAGLLHFLFLSAFVWMFIEAVLLFICVKNLSQISSKKKEVLSSGFLCVIGYVVSLVVVCVSVGLVPEGYGSEHCWIEIDKGFIWSFLGPVCVILALNMILFISIVIILKSTFKNLNAEVSQMKQTKIMVFKTLAQFVVLGCSWILGFFTKDSKVLEILFLILNSQQGTFIFLIYCVLNHEVRQQYRKFFMSLLY